MAHKYVVLTQAEQVLAKYVAEQRYQENRQAGVVDSKVGPQSCEQTNGSRCVRC